MLLKEIELDLPYEENMIFLEQLKKEGIKHQEAIAMDYDLNWKDKRRAFQLCTRCMTAMIERICFPLKNDLCQKILIECVSHKTYSGYKILLGVCVVQVEFDYMKFCVLSNMEKKIFVLNTVLDAVKQIPEFEKYMLQFDKVIKEVLDNNCNNVWFWKKSAKKGKHTLKIQIVHDVHEVKINLVIFENGKEILAKTAISTLPDERVYEFHLGNVGWDTANIAYLQSKQGNKYTVSI